MSDLVIRKPTVAAREFENHSLVYYSNDHATSYDMIADFILLNNDQVYESLMPRDVEDPLPTYLNPGTYYLIMLDGFQHIAVYNPNVQYGGQVGGYFKVLFTNENAIRPGKYRELKYTTVIPPAADIIEFYKIVGDVKVFNFNMKGIDTDGLLEKFNDSALIHSRYVNGSINNT
jgi:hypothetical protein